MNLMGKIDIFFVGLCVVMMSCLAVFAYVDCKHLEIEYLLAAKGDELIQIIQFRRMYEALLDLDIIKFLFSFDFYNYGFCWYILNFFVTAPFFALQSYESAIYAPRILEAVFSLLNIFALYKIIKFYTNSYTAFFCSLLFISMPGFWSIGTLVKPDMFQGFFILMSAYFLFQDKMKFAKNYILSVSFLGLGLGLAKFQAIMFIPMIYIYICLPLLLHFSKETLIQALKRMFFSLIWIMLLWIITNPYLLFGFDGIKAWWGQFEFNMWSNATNHGSFTQLTLSDKLKLIDDTYFEIASFIILLILCVWIITRFLRDKSNPYLSSFISVLGGFLVSLTYLFFFTNKVWASYYLSTILLGIMIFGLAINKVLKKYPSIIKILLLCLFIFLNAVNAILNNSYKNFLANEAPRVEILKERSPTIINALKQVVPQNTKYTILSNVGFSYRQLGIDPKDVTITYDGVDLSGDFIVLYKAGRLFEKIDTRDRYADYSIKVFQALENNATNYKKIFDSDKVVIFQNLNFDKK